MMEEEEGLSRMTKLYKFLNDMKSENGNHKWEKGKWYSVDGKLRMCRNGFHASQHVQDALMYVQGNNLAVVEVDGEHIEREDKECWERMRVVETYDWTRIESLKLAIYSAQRSKDNFYGDELIIQDCIDAVERILGEIEEGREPSDELIESAKSAESEVESGESAAESAAWYATRTARWSVESAKSAARAATRAARSAKWSAARSTWSAESSKSAKSAAKQDIHQYCLEILREEED